MSSRPFCHCHNGSTNFTLDGTFASVVLADVHASVDISQRFTNPLDSPLSAVYTFGLISGATICQFQMIRADGTKVEGIVEEKEKAKKEYEKAVKRGHTAALGSEVTKDVFSISLGNIAALETITIHVRYLQTLTDDEKRDQVRFSFPRGYTHRYGAAPSSTPGLAHAPEQPFSMDIVVQQGTPIKSISCPSGHPMEIELGKPDRFDVDPSTMDSQLATVTINDSSGSLDKDILLIVTATNLDYPRCFVEAHPSPSEDSVAMGLTFVPRFTLPDVPGGMEYIFLVDRSGSMEGQSMKLVREALVVLLRGLPTKATKLNIFSFGSSTTKFWKSSQEYSQVNLEAATKHVDSMTANYSGTEIASALQLVYASLPKPFTQPVAIFLLTDGGAWDVATCVSHTTKALEFQTTQANFLRVFTVGIGDGVSTDTCDSIARAGNGISVYVAPNESVIGKCSRLVRAARTPPMKDLQVCWPVGDDSGQGEEDFEIVETTSWAASFVEFDHVTPVLMSLFDDDDDMAAGAVGPPPPQPQIALPPVSKVQQAPLKLVSWFPGTRSQMYAIIKGKQTSVPESIMIRGTVSTTGAVVELHVPITKLAISSTSSFPFLHVLAAKALITDRENGVHNSPALIADAFKDNKELQDAYLEKEIVRLGKTYGLTSRHTSFVAVDYHHRIGHSLRTPTGSDDDEDEIDEEGPAKKRQRRLHNAGQFLDMIAEVSDDDDDDDEDCEDFLVVDEDSEDSAPAASGSGSNATGLPSAATMDSGRLLAAIARLQQFDGGFSLKEDILLLLTVSASLEEVTQICEREGLDRDVVATLLAREWMKINGGDESLDLQEKAMDWLIDSLGDESAVAKAQESIARLVPSSSRSEHP